MSLKFSPRERLLLFITFLVAVLFIYWYLFFNPLFLSIQKSELAIKDIQMAVENAKGYLLAEAKQKEIKLYPKEEQLSLLIKYINDQFGSYGIKLDSMQQAPDEEHKLVVQVSFSASYDSLKSILKAMADSDLPLSIERVKMQSTNGAVLVEMKLLSDYL